MHHKTDIADMYIELLCISYNVLDSSITYINCKYHDFTILFYEDKT